MQYQDNPMLQSQEKVNKHADSGPAKEEEERRNSEREREREREREKGREKDSNKEWRERVDKTQGG